LIEHVERRFIVCNSSLPSEIRKVENGVEQFSTHSCMTCKDGIIAILAGILEM